MLYPLTNIPPFPSPLSLWKPSFFCFYEFSVFKFHTQVKSYSTLFRIFPLDLLRWQF